jgi:hypothetical protein
MMSALELFALLIGPLLMFGAGVAVYFLTASKASATRRPAE